MKAAIMALVVVVVATLIGCMHTEPVQTTFDRPYPERNSAGDPILAIFVGRIPCAVEGCEMRKVELVLYGREGGRVPTTYWLGQVGVGMGDERVVQEGTWSGRRGVPAYPQAQVYTLDANADPSLRHLWRVDDEVVLVLDERLQPRAGNAAWGYMLSRDCAPYGPRTYAYDKGAKRFVVPSSNRFTCSRAATPDS
jgi:hypothetical protein